MHSRFPRHILIVEDEWLIALDLQTMIEEQGHVTLGPVNTVKDALKIIGEHRIDAAFLDINLGKEKSWPVANELARRKIAFTFISAYTKKEVPDNFSDFALLSKPVDNRVFLKQLERMLNTE